MASFSFGRARVAHRSLGLVGAGFALSLTAAAMTSSARAQEIEVDGCVGGWFSAGCTTIWAPAEDPFIRTVPQPEDPAGRARVARRDRRWADRCRPSIVQDRYGVARYTYAQPGCEFGVGDIGDAEIR